MTQDACDIPLVSLPGARIPPMVFSSPWSMLHQLDSRDVIK
jgi:hypothetical protein